MENLYENGYIFQRVTSSIYRGVDGDNWYLNYCTYVGMPEEYNEAPSFYVSFHGTEEGQVEWITEDSGERYVATSKMVAIGPASYNIRVIGEENQWKEVRETLKKVLPYFEDKELTEE